MLKDGSFHLVREYRREGNRVRYYSVERSAWEEIPADLVDWDATRKAEATEAKRLEEAVEKVRAAQAAERANELDVDASIQVAPGVFLPPGEGLFAVEDRIVTPLVQAAADIKLSKGRLVGQILSPIPIVPSKHKVQLSEKRARHRLTTGQPEFYVRTADAREPEMELIRAQVKGNTRLLEFISTNIAGQQSAKRESISVQRWQVAKGVFRLTTSQRLEPGEYAIAEILPEGMNLFVWDFGIDPSGGAPGRKPAPAAPKKTAATSKPKQ